MFKCLKNSFLDARPHVTYVTISQNLVKFGVHNLFVFIVKEMKPDSNEIKADSKENKPDSKENKPKNHPVKTKTFQLVQDFQLAKIRS